CRVEPRRGDLPRARGLSSDGRRNARGEPRSGPARPRGREVARQRGAGLPPRADRQPTRADRGRRRRLAGADRARSRHRLDPCPPDFRPSSLFGDLPMTFSTRYNVSLLSLLLGLALVACGKPGPSPAPTAAGEKIAEDDHAPGEAAHEEEGHDEEGHEEGEAIELSAEAVATAGIVTAPAVSRRLRAELETTGSVDFDQRRFAHVSPRVGG